MTDKKEIIALLERYMDSPRLAGIENYGAKIVDMPATLIEDCIKILKAQEPRIMTLKELRDIGSIWELDGPPFLWMEINPTFKWRRGFWVSWHDIYDMIDNLHPTYDSDNYLKLWRLWTKTPTKEQRIETAWN